MCEIASPQDLLMQLFSLQRQARSPEQDGGDTSAVGRELLDLVLAYNTNSSDTSDDGGDA